MAISPFEAAINITIAALSAPSSGETSILTNQGEVTEFLSTVYETCCKLEAHERGKDLK